MNISPNCSWHKHHSFHTSRHHSFHTSITVSTQESPNNRHCVDSAGRETCLKAQTRNNNSNNNNNRGVLEHPFSNDPLVCTFLTQAKTAHIKIHKINIHRFVIKHRHPSQCRNTRARARTHARTHAHTHTQREIFNWGKLETVGSVQSKRQRKD